MLWPSCTNATLYQRAEDVKRSNFTKLGAASGISSGNATSAGREISWCSFTAERTIAASPERVFDWLADPASLTASPSVLKAGYAKGSAGPGVGAMGEVTGFGV
jgi:hypothetical protein